MHGHGSVVSLFSSFQVKHTWLYRDWRGLIKSALTAICNFFCNLHFKIIFAFGLFLFYIYSCFILNGFYEMLFVICMTIIDCFFTAK